MAWQINNLHPARPQNGARQNGEGKESSSGRADIHTGRSGRLHGERAKEQEMKTLKNIYDQVELNDPAFDLSRVTFYR